MPRIWRSASRRERIKKTITDDDQQRLADRYVQQLKH